MFNEKMKKFNIFWFRRDLRLDDNMGLYHALKGKEKVLPLFVFDKEILDQLEDKSDARLTIIWDKLKEINKALKDLDSALRVEYGYIPDIFDRWSKEFRIQAVFTNGDEEPQAGNARRTSSGRWSRRSARC